MEVAEFEFTLVLYHVISSERVNTRLFQVESFLSFHNLEISS